MKQEFNENFKHKLEMPQKPNENYAKDGKHPLIVLIPGASAKPQMQPMSGLSSEFKKEGVGLLTFEMEETHRTPLPLVKKTEYVAEIFRQTLEEHPEIDRERIVVIGHSQGGAIIRLILKRILEMKTTPAIVTLNAIRNLKQIRKAAKTTHKALYPRATEEAAKKITDAMLAGFDEKKAVDHLSKYNRKMQLHVVHRQDESMPRKTLPDFWRTKKNIGLPGNTLVIDTESKVRTTKEKIRVHLFEEEKAFNEMLQLVLPWIRKKITPKP